MDQKISTVTVRNKINQKSSKFFGEICVICTCDLISHSENKEKKERKSWERTAHKNNIHYHLWEEKVNKI